MSIKKRLVVAVDLDEVLGQFLNALVQYYNQEKQKTFAVSDFFSYRFCDVWGGTNEEATEVVHAFFETEFFKQRILPIDDAKQVLEKWKGKDIIDFYVVTSRQTVILEETKAWLEQHYSGIFKGILSGNHWARENAHLGMVTSENGGGKDSNQPELVPSSAPVATPSNNKSSSRSKAEMCREIEANLLIDDAPAYAKDCLENVSSMRKVVLFGDYGWNQKVPEEIASMLENVDDEQKRVVRCADWLQVDKELEKLVAEFVVE
ncbi:unnamed protein product [Amoebophrya sp. A120]|nr:unnamed protein product [Amoebophrya sp. A120]|eukprot:GSA120T00023604001.1